ncbi:hypothetical protein FACS1894110_15830 [Spirochaetia bacterium]|nr:hypothetical protein FACS1894110_15830 [Spirochaetia bacterium]
MEKIFEDYFTELQADMVDICLEYVENKAEEIYIYVSREGRTQTGNVFYKINNMFVKKYELNDALTEDERKKFQYDVSDVQQNGVLAIINEDIEKIEKLCKQYDKAMPTEMKIVYDVAKTSMKAEYRYDLVYTNDPDKLGNDIFDEWYEKVKILKEEV